VRKYFVGEHYREVSTTMLLFNFDPRTPLGYRIYELEALDMQPLWDLCPWRGDDPRHRLSAMRAPPLQLEGAVLPHVADDDTALAAGTTTHAVGAPRGPLPASVVWTEKAYSKGEYALPASPWAHPTERWFREPGAHVAQSYEQLLLTGDARLPLATLPALVGKQLACWCREATWRCPANVLLKYVRAYETKPEWRAAFEAYLAAEAATRKGYFDAR